MGIAGLGTIRLIDAVHRAKIASKAGRSTKPRRFGPAAKSARGRTGARSGKSRVGHPNAPARAPGRGCGLHLEPGR